MRSSDQKRLLYQATHRGTKEADLLLGGFVEKHLDTLSAAELGELSLILELSDEEIVRFVLQGVSLHGGEKYALLEKIKSFYGCSTR